MIDDLSCSLLQAWYRRGRVWADLQSYGRATEDLEKALFLEKSAHGRNQVSRELDKVKSLTGVAESGKSDGSGMQWKGCDRKWRISMKNMDYAGGHTETMPWKCPNRILYQAFCIHFWSTRKWHRIATGSRIWKSGVCSSLDGVCPYWTAEKQWGLQATENLASGSLVLDEEAVAAVSDLITSSELIRLLIVSASVIDWRWLWCLGQAGTTHP